MATKIATKTKMKDADKAVQNSMNRVVENIKKASPKGKVGTKNHSFATNFSATTSIWPAAGTLDVAGFAYYVMSADLVATNGSDWGGIEFTASGWGAIAGAFECYLVGAFGVDPSTIVGNCQWVLVVGAVEEGGVSLTLLSESGTFYGNFEGYAEGIGAGSWSSSNGVLSWI